MGEAANDQRGVRALLLFDSRCNSSKFEELPSQDVTGVVMRDRPPPAGRCVCDERLLLEHALRVRRFYSEIKIKETIVPGHFEEYEKSRLCDGAQRQRALLIKRLVTETDYGRHGSALISPLSGEFCVCAGRLDASAPALERDGE
ncbi:hypothetical protein EVAR_63008_1 [Eumeta japonica]|uniref:Uncharacterized protein n=1 Tax=Eumeta variegata TaxID=151549 RepID=A0A4C1YRX4_EUMVA|nr:hypothetical protein EVAR_63008_1 [Eumeta japonica]